MDVREAGRKGGLASNETMTPEQRRERAKKAAFTRWNKKDNDNVC